MMQRTTCSSKSSRMKSNIIGCFQTCLERTDLRPPHCADNERDDSALDTAVACRSRGEKVIVLP